MKSHAETMKGPTQPEPAVEKMPGHWVLARMGKRVLRPGGVELTRLLLADLDITAQDDVVEFAPGLGITTRMALERNPASYTAIERDRDAAAMVSRVLKGDRNRCIAGSAEQTGLGDASATVVYGEAMLSMQTAAAKSRIVGEAARILKPGGRYGIHELCMVPDEVDHATRDAIQKELTDEIHVGVRPLTVREWRELLESSGLAVKAVRTAPMHLLEPRRLIRDEGLPRALKFLWNVAWHAAARRRVKAMRRVFRKYANNLGAVAMVGMKQASGSR